MKAHLFKSERLHSLDSLRAIMMLLGIVMHSSIPYWVSDMGFNKDSNATHISNDLVALLIHYFRMPIFFLVAGFFGALLFYDRGIVKMLKNRASRVLYPFIIFLILLYPTIIFSWKFADAVFAGSDNAIRVAKTYFNNPTKFLPKGTEHLWFLYYIIFFTVGSSILALAIKKIPTLSINISKIFDFIIQKPFIKVLFFGGISFIIFVILRTSSIPHSNSFIPATNVFIYYFYFYIVGWLLYKSKHLLSTFKQLDWFFTIAGLLMFIISLAIIELKLFNIPRYQIFLIILLRSIIIWLFIFGITGLFLRYASNHSSRMRYISDASYWVYLIHYPLTIFIPPLLIGWIVPSTIKFLSVLTITCLISFGSYHYFVRSTFIGKFLNGRKYHKQFDKKTKI